MTAKIDENLQYVWGSGQNTGMSYILAAPDLKAVLDNHAAQLNRGVQTCISIAWVIRTCIEKDFAPRCPR
jgi:hypothetical protein